MSAANKRNAILLAVLALAIVGYLIVPSYYASLHQIQIVASLETKRTGEIEAVRKEAEQGNAEAQNLMGDLFYKGEVVPQDLEEAFKWYSKAAANNNADAQNLLGILYDSGKGVDENYEIAFQWFLKSANQGHPSAMSNVGRCYFAGKGIQQNKLEALKWLQKSADKGVTSDESIIGLEYLEGKSLPRDYEKAFNYLNRAAHKGDAEAQLSIANMYFHGRFVETDFSKAGKFYGLAVENQIPEESKVQIKAFLARHAKNCSKNRRPNGIIVFELDSCFLASSTNDPDVLHAIGFAYFVGDKSVKKDLKKAFEYISRSAKLRNPSSQIQLAAMYDTAQGAPTDLVEYYAWLSAAETYPNLVDIQRKIIDTGKRDALKDLGLIEEIKARLKAREYVRKYGFKSQS